MGLYYVSIPYSSGLSFRVYDLPVDSLTFIGLNPLFIRSQFQRVKDGAVSTQVAISSQSLIHQVSVSESDEMLGLARKKKSQSLIHQVSVSEPMHFFNRWPEVITFSLNPLFIRSQFQRAAFFQLINTDS